MVGCVLKEDHPPPSMCKAPRALGQSWQLCVIHLGQSLGGDSIPGGSYEQPPTQSLSLEHSPELPEWGEKAQPGWYHPINVLRVAASRMCVPS